MNNTFAQDVEKGLESNPKFLSSKYFYDAIGDQLFVKIMQLPEYYLTNCELEIFQNQSDEIIKAFEIENESFEIYELGAGDGTKTIELLKEIKDKNFRFIPIDISPDALNTLSMKLKEVLPELQFEGRQGEYFEILNTLKGTDKKIILFLGSNIGNLNDNEARSFICNIASKMNDGDMFFLGVDLKKSKDIILPAYNDSQGITSDFNLNLLDRINRELGGNFDKKRFSHLAEYDEEVGVAYSYLQSEKDLKVYIESLDKTFDFKKGERIHTEISRKYDEQILNKIITGSGLKINKLFYDSRKYFCNALFEKRTSTID